MGSVTTMEPSRVALGSIHLTLQNVLSTLIAVFGLAYIARTISQEEMGALTAIALATSAIQLASDFGLASSLAKFVSELRGREEDISAYFISAILFKAPASLLLCSALLLLFGSVPLVQSSAMPSSELINLIAVDAFMLALITPFNSVLLGSGHLKRMALCGISSTAARWLAIMFLVWEGYGFCGAVVGWIVGDLTAVLLLAVSTAKLVTINDDLLSKGISLLPSLLRFSWPLFVASIVSFLYAWYDRALVFAFLPLEDLGVYDISCKAFGVLASTATALGSSLFPYYGMAYGRNDHAAISAGIRRASGYTMMIVFPLTLGLFATSRAVITLFAGQMYEAGWGILAILSLSGLVYGVLPSFADLLLIYGKTKTMLPLSFIPVASSLFLLPSLWVLGLNALALMRGSSLLLTLFLTMYFLSRIVEIEIDRQRLVKTLASSAFMVAAVLAVQQICYTEFLLPAYALTGVVVYLAGMRLLKVLSEPDIELLRQIFGERTVRYVRKILR